MNRKPLAIDLFCGLGGWTEGLLAEGYEVIGYDIEAHEYGDEKYPATLVLRDVLTIHGSEFKDADLIVASPPCQEFSYMAMPWGLAKAKAVLIRADETGAELERLTALFDACFRIQREASAAAGRHIPMVVENVKGAQPWVGRAAWNFGSYYLWGDVPALMPGVFKGSKNGDIGGGSWFAIGSPGQKETGRNPVHALASEGIKVPSLDGKSRTSVGSGARFTSRLPEEGVKQGGDWFNAASGGICRTTGSKSPARKAASARIAKIPFALSSHIARVYKPRLVAVA